MKIYMISLGCQKNKVDSEVMLGNLLGSSFELTTNFREANLIMINTCAFIESAKQEAIDTILEVVDNKTQKQMVMVLGCLSTRYDNEIAELIPEVDRFVSIKEYPKLKEIVNSLFAEHLLSGKFDFNSRFLTKANYSVDVKISEGCNNRCSYCAIPLIRGPFVSRDKESIINEVKSLVASGTREINLISQDTTNYGYGLYTDYGITELLNDLVKIEGNFKIRMLYLYPYLVSDKLIDFIANNDKVMPYFDIPIQHSENHLLKAMNRRDSKEGIISLVKKIKERIPNAILRTTLIVGFPGETEEDFKNLLDFVKEMKFDRLGAFSYSPEEGTTGALMFDQIDEEIKNKRLEALYLVQDDIALEQNKKHIGEYMDALIEEYDEGEFCYIGRSYAFAPDDIDGTLYIYNSSLKDIKIGDVVTCKVIDADINSLIAIIEGEE